MGDRWYETREIPRKGNLIGIKFFESSFTDRNSLQNAFLFTYRLLSFSTYTYTSMLVQNGLYVSISVTNGVRNEKDHKYKR